MYSFFKDSLFPQTSVVLVWNYSKVTYEHLRNIGVGGGEHYGTFIG